MLTMNSRVTRKSHDRHFKLMRRQQGANNNNNRRVINDFLGIYFVEVFCGSGFCPAGFITILKSLLFQRQSNENFKKKRLNIFSFYSNFHQNTLIEPTFRL